MGVSGRIQLSRVAESFHHIFTSLEVAAQLPEPFSALFRSRQVTLPPDWNSYSQVQGSGHTGWPHLDDPFTDQDVQIAAHFPPPLLIGNRFCPFEALARSLKPERMRSKDAD